MPDTESKKINKNPFVCTWIIQIIGRRRGELPHYVIRMIQSSAPNKKLVSHIDVDIDESFKITLTNDGNGIDVAKHPEEDLYPEMIFGHLRTSTNYDKTQKKS